MGSWDSAGPYANNLHLAPVQTVTPATLKRAATNFAAWWTEATPHHSIFTGRMLFLTSNQQCPSTKGLPNTRMIFTTMRHLESSYFHEPKWNCTGRCKNEHWLLSAVKDATVGPLVCNFTKCWLTFKTVFHPLLQQQICNRVVVKL